MTAALIPQAFTLPLLKAIEPRVLTFGLLALDIFVSSKANPQVLPALGVMLEAESLSPAELLVEIAGINLVFLSASALKGCWSHRELFVCVLSLLC